LDAIAKRVTTAVDDLERATGQLLDRADQPEDAAAVAVPYLHLAAITTGGWLMARSAQAAQQELAGANGQAPFLAAKMATARFFAEHILPQSTGLTQTVSTGAAAALGLPIDEF
jgi:hypothetical protein